MRLPGSACKAYAHAGKDARAPSEALLDNWQTRGLALSYGISGGNLMFCSSCGSSVSPSLTFCNFCGEKLNKAKEHDEGQLPRATYDSLIWGIVGTTVGGLGVLIGLMAVMKETLHFNDGLILAFSLLSFSLIAAADASLITLLLRNTRRAKERNNEAEIREMITKELNAAQQRALREPAPSVSEHTTRSMETAYKNRDTQ
jgi:predicted amidophosphoribosyltransferase